MIDLRQCDCVRCASVRLAWRLFLAGVAVLVLIGILHHAGDKPPLLVDATPAAHRDMCGRTVPDLLDRRFIRGGTFKSRDGGRA
jgi:hypothetical protein